MNLNDILNFTGTGLAAVLLVLNLISKKTLIGSFFKTYYTLMTIALASLVLSFSAELPTTPFGASAAELIHHILFIVFIVFSFVAARYLPKEAAKYMEKK